MRILATDVKVPRSLASGLLVLLLGLGVLPACTAQGGNTDSGSEELVARIDGKPVTMADLEAQAAAQLRQLESQRYQILQQSLNALVEQKLFSIEAEKRGVTVDELIEAEVNAANSEITDAQVDEWYEQNKARVRQPKEAVADQIRNLLSQQGKQEARGNFVKSLREQYDVDILLEPQRVEVAVGDAPTKGPADAPITIVEWSDFECPYCSRVNPALKKVEETYGDKVRFAFRQFPLSFHQNAQKAAEASLCANDQGKFWEMHDSMFANQQALAVDSLKSQAAELGMDAEKFNECLDSDRYAKRVADDMAAGQEAGVSGTPSIFINGRPMAGAVPYEQLAEVIEEELKRKGAE